MGVPQINSQRQSHNVKRNYPRLLVRPASCRSSHRDRPTAEHGTSKYINFPATEYFANGVEVFSLMGLAGALEIIGGLLIIVGLFTRLTAFVLAGFLAAAYFMGHAPQGFFPLINNGDAAILFCFIFLYFSAAGAGPWSLDANRE
jgi:putative oxidoreductase